MSINHEPLFARSLPCPEPLRSTMVVDSNNTYVTKCFEKNNTTRGMLEDLGIMSLIGAWVAACGVIGLL